MRRAGERGYALVAAVASIAVFAALSLTVMLQTRTSLVTGGGEFARAQAGAAADAGIALALRGLLDGDIASRWSIDGRPHPQRFGRASLRIRVEDERGKVPLNQLDEAFATRLLETVGLQGERLEIARDSLLDWTDEDQEPRANGAETDYYAPRGLQVRNGSPASIGELARVRGFDPALVEKIREIATLSLGRGSFDSRYATPLAIQVMRGDEGAVEMLGRQREQGGQRTAIELSRQDDLVGRPLTIVVDAVLPNGGKAHRAALVELTGSPVRPYVVRSYE